MPKTPLPRSSRTFTILSRIFIPVGAVLLAGGIIMLSFGIVALINVIPALEQSGECTQIGSSVRCAGPVSTEFAGAVVLTSFGSVAFFCGLPLLVVGCVFHGVARNKRRKAEAERPINPDEGRYAE